MDGEATMSPASYAGDIDAVPVRGATEASPRSELRKALASIALLIHLKARPGDLKQGGGVIERGRRGSS
jgi:hypothetical protein